MTHSLFVPPLIIRLALLKRLLKCRCQITSHFCFSVHIFFDDAFEQGKSDDEDDRLPNKFVKQLINVMDEAASNVHEKNIILARPTIIPTPYGGKFVWTLPGGNLLTAHLKDKILIRHRKRWSQVTKIC